MAFLTHRTSGAGWTSAWAPDHPVLEVLRARRQSSSKPGSRTDGFRVALALEGGGMRGAISAAMVSAIEECGFRDAVDVVYGTSSGAVNAAYFVAGTTWLPLSIYFDDLPSRTFVDFRRALVRRPIMNIDYAYEEVVRTRKPLDHGAVVRSPIKLVVTVSDVDALTTLAATDFTSTEDLHAALRASAWLPIAVRGTTDFRGRRSVDGGVLMAHPRTQALRDGATHVLSCSTKPMGSPRGGVRPGTRLVIRYMDRLEPGLGAGYRRALEALKDDQGDLARQRVSPAPRGPWVLDAAPLPGTEPLGRQEMRPWKILQACRDSFTLMASMLEGVPEAAVRSGEVSSVPRLALVKGGRPWA
ncbi:patatin-like phospholipase family protein [Quadrisphaera setariae]|uniref:Patatin n=1 Tax=Quadrisphaera setariae TaxID=2593304 RepID=A0A5C8ZGI8_9ACTN|nr:patatin-like phospholipase family protein [Quadrisphaera setariae]TXR56308.1 patatin [Quadrisphaera setariae]